jgi:hypothetical protein
VGQVAHHGQARSGLRPHVHPRRTPCDALERGDPRARREPEHRSSPTSPSPSIFSE